MRNKKFYQLFKGSTSSLNPKKRKYRSVIRVEYILISHNTESKEIIEK